MIYYSSVCWIHAYKAFRVRSKRGVTPSRTARYRSVGYDGHRSRRASDKLPVTQAVTARKKIGGSDMYAIIATGGKQYKVEEGDIIRVEKLDVKEGEEITFEEVLMIGDKTVKIGDPTVSGASVKATVMAEGKEKKVIVYRYKPKTGYHKKNGHRQPFTQVKIDKIIA